MHGAGFQGRAEIAKQLIAHGLNPSDRHVDGFTPLHRACWGQEQRHTETARVLLEAGVPADEAPVPPQDGRRPKPGAKFDPLSQTNRPQTKAVLREYLEKSARVRTEL